MSELLARGPISITLPYAGTRFRSIKRDVEDHDIVGKIEDGAGTYTYDRQKVGTRYCSSRRAPS